MPKLINVLYLTVVFNFFSYNSFAQNLNYEIVWKNDSIGSLSASRKPVNNFVKYIIESEVSVKFIGRLDMEYSFENVFSNGVLVKATTQNISNNKIKSSSELSWNGKSYKASVDGDEVKVPNKPIRQSMATLYFKEPKGLQEIFSERYAVFCSINEVAPHKYELVLPNGRKNYYTYENGICTLVEVNHSLATFYFKIIRNNGKIVMN